MECERDLRVLPEWAGFGQGFGAEDIQNRMSGASGIKGGDQGRFVDKITAPGVEEGRAGLHFRKELGAEKVAGFFGRGKNGADVV